MFNATPRALYPQECPGTHYIGGGVGFRAGLDGCGKSRHFRDSILGLSSQQRAEINIAVAPLIKKKLIPSAHFPAKGYIRTVSILLIYEMHKHYFQNNCLHLSRSVTYLLRSLMYVSLVSFMPYSSPISHVTISHCAQLKGTTSECPAMA